MIVLSPGQDGDGVDGFAIELAMEYGSCIHYVHSGVNKYEKT